MGIDFKRDMILETENPRGDFTRFLRNNGSEIPKLGLSNLSEA